LADVFDRYGSRKRSGNIHGSLYFDNGFAAYGASGGKQQRRKQRFDNFRTEDSMSRQIAWFAAKAGQQKFVLPLVPASIFEFFLNGLIENPSTYSFKGNVVTTTLVPDVDDTIAIVYDDGVIVSTVVAYPPSLPTSSTLTSAQFRSDFPEFADKTIYTESAFRYWCTLAFLMLNAPRWGSVLLIGIELFIAHNLVIETQAQQTALNQGWPGESRGAINNESAGEVTVSYDTATTLEEGAGHWNLTVYGTRFINLAKMMGAGGMQVGPCGSGDLAGVVPGAQDGGPAWSGPNCLPGQSTFGS
jgi:hypothetical protein